MDETGKALETVGMLGALWFLSAVAHSVLGPKPPPKAERLCGYHMSSVNRRRHLAVLDSAGCEICKEEGISNVSE